MSLNSHYAALLEQCCCIGPEGDCDKPCIYIVVDGDWVFLPNSPEPECEGDCHCLAPDIVPECPEQIAGCQCIRDSQSAPSDSTPPCVYTDCDVIDP